MNLIFDDKDDKEVKVRNLSIEKNIFEYEGSFLQISNISYATIIKERFHLLTALQKAMNTTNWAT